MLINLNINKLNTYFLSFINKLQIENNNRLNNLIIVYKLFILLLNYKINK